MSPTNDTVNPYFTKETHQDQDFILNDTGTEMTEGFYKVDVDDFINQTHDTKDKFDTLMN